MIRKVDKYIVELLIRYNFKDGIVNSIEFDTHIKNYHKAVFLLRALGYKALNKYFGGQFYNYSEKLIVTCRENIFIKLL